MSLDIVTLLRASKEMAQELHTRFNLGDKQVLVAQLAEKATSALKILEQTGLDAEHAAPLRHSAQTAHAQIRQLMEGRKFAWIFTSNKKLATASNALDEGLSWLHQTTGLVTGRYPAAQLEPSLQAPPSSLQSIYDLRQSDIVTYADGEYSGSKFNGWGNVNFGNGIVYEGTFKEGKPSDWGRLTYADGSVYEGKFEFGKPNGKGKLSAASFMYEGDFWNGKFHGRGRHSSNGVVHEGEFEKGDFRRGNIRIPGASFVYFRRAKP